MNLKIVLDKGAIAPTKAHETDAGYDLYAYAEVFIPPGAQRRIRTGVKMAIPLDYFGKIFSRSGLAVKKNLGVDAGVIDNSYRGEVEVVMRNYSNVAAKIMTGDKIAQIVFLPYLTLNILEVQELDESDRGAAGFGSTG